MGRFSRCLGGIKKRMRKTQASHELPGWESKVLVYDWLWSKYAIYVWVNVCGLCSWRFYYTVSLHHPFNNNFVHRFGVEVWISRYDWRFRLRITNFIILMIAFRIDLLMWVSVYIPMSIWLLHICLLLLPFIYIYDDGYIKESDNFRFSLLFSIYYNIECGCNSNFSNIICSFFLRWIPTTITSRYLRHHICYIHTKKKSNWLRQLKKANRKKWSISEIVINREELNADFESVTPWHRHAGILYERF